MRLLVRTAMLAAGTALILFQAGCAFVFPPPLPPAYPSHIPRLDKDLPSSKLSDVGEALKLGDRYRDHARQVLFSDVTQWGNGYWFAQESKKYYRHVVENLQPNNAYAVANLGYISLMLARTCPSGKQREIFYGQAMSKFKQADENRRGYAAAHVYIGELYATRGEWGPAAQAFDRLLQGGIENAYVHAWYGYVLKRQGRPEEARRHFLQAVEDGSPEAAATWARKQL